MNFFNFYFKKIKLSYSQLGRFESIDKHLLTIENLAKSFDGNIYEKVSSDNF